MSEIERLRKRLSGARNFRVFWGDDARRLTPEERATEINRMLDRIDAGDCEESRDLGDSGRPKIDVERLVATLDGETEQRALAR